MTEQEIIEKIKYIQKYQTETDQIEAKTAEIDFPKKCYDTISAFSNKYGGIIIFGINENNNFIEQDVYDVNDLQKKVTALCTNCMEPKVRPTFLPIKYNNKTLLAVKIDEIPQVQKPCYYKDLGMHKGSYIRIGDSDEHMTEYEIYCLNSYKDGVQEDKRPIKIATLEDLNKEKINTFLEKAKKDKPNFAKFSDEKILKLCGVIDNSTGTIYPTLAGLMLFGEYPQGFLPQLFIACVVVPGTKWAETGEIGQRFNDNQSIEGTLDEMLEQALAFIRRNISIKVIIDDNGERTDIPEYPMKALREAIANALVHRDYSISRESAYIYIKIFTDRIEIINPGDLYGNNRLEALGTDIMLEVRNKSIVKLLEINNSIIENRHTGIVTMIDEMKKMNLPEPKFESLRGDFKVTFYKSWTEVDTSKQKIDGQRWTEVDRDGQISDDSIDYKIISLIKQNSHITQAEMSKELSLGRSTITNHIKSLKAKKIIDRVGPDNGGYWKIL